MVWLLGVLGCMVITDARHAERLDPDGDGVPWPEDCGPEDAAIWPGATELPDGVDNDCDGMVDEDVVETETDDANACFLDADADGHAGNQPTACTEPNSYPAISDCDDADPAVFPGTSCAVDEPWCGSTLDGTCWADGVCRGAPVDCPTCDGPCGVDACCESGCGEGSCDCEVGACIVDCGPGTCSTSCAPNTACSVVGPPDTGLDAVCTGASCDVACAGDGSCGVVCEQGAVCAIACTGDGDCDAITCSADSLCSLACDSLNGDCGMTCGGACDVTCSSVNGTCDLTCDDPAFPSVSCSSGGAACGVCP